MSSKTTAELPALIVPDDNTSLVSIVEQRMAEYPDHPAFLRPADQAAKTDADAPFPGWHVVSGREFWEDVRRLAAHLQANGVQAGTKVAIMSPSSYAWSVADLAVMYLRAVVVPIYETSSVPQAAHMLSAAEVSLALGTDTTRPILLQAGLKPEQVLALEVPQGQAPALEATRATGSDVASIVFTSGTTGDSKGVKITHGNMLSQVLNVQAAYREIVHDHGRTLIFLPLAHILARGLQFACLVGGMTIAHEPVPKRAIEELGTVRPTFLVCPPRLLEKIQDAVEDKFTGMKLSGVWRRAKAVAIARGKYEELRDLGQSPSPLGKRQRALFKLFDATVFRLIRSKFGGTIEYLLSGAAPLSPELSWFFRGAGIPVVEGYGLTETTAPATGNRPGAVKSGTVGPPIPGTAVRIAPGGEVQLRGPGVFSGYLDGTGLDDGWFSTGDLGHLDADGYLTITGRTKGLLITSYGKNVNPQGWEASVSRCSAIDDALVIGEGRNYLTALIFLARDLPLAPWQGPGEEARIERAQEVPAQVRAAIDAAVERANADVSKAEHIRRYTIVQFSSTGDAITPTLKLRRHVVERAGADIIESMYS